METWRVLWVERVFGDKYSVTYLIGKKRRVTAQVDATFGLEKALTEMGIQLASMPPQPDTRIARS